jgi:O-antigen ligase
LFSKKYSIKFISFLGLICSLLTILLSLGRTSLVASIVITIIFFFYIFKKKRYRFAIIKKILFIMIVLFICMVVVLSTSEVMSDNFQKLIERIVKTSLTYEQAKLTKQGMRHVLMWEFAWNVFRERWLLGQGFETFSVSMEEFYRIPGLSAHGIIVNVATSSGILGVTLFFALVVKSIICFFKYMRLASKYKTYSNEIFIICIFSAYIGLLVAGFLEPVLFNPYLLLFLGIISVYSKSIEREKRSRNFLD